MMRSTPTAGSRGLTVTGLIGILVVVVSALLLGVSGGGATGIDIVWFDVLAAHRWQPLESAALALNYVGGTLSMTIVTIVVVVVLLVLRRVREAIVIGGSVAIATAISTMIKLSLGRPRPPGALAEVETSSFPSGHTTAAAALTIAVALLVDRLWMWVLAVAWVLAMAFSRTYLLVHWATDVTAGAILGASVALVVFAAVQGLLARRARVTPSAAV
ncbi:membrane-associated phospholipid phosphatase [Microbacteriaceae bacterium SG_E_30_P1]|uniref:Membrane-associated phospholipid phosphatase n=1 Tax=Antiquaquibacter oligotrophicus TaxID=2880260 RepID=A0ABT6KQ39_9MICO|nr:phosphatase PAP2 family protein [Antiquaquibacter oligotrophicus]MDH6182086.1 membrane-associated phospholipid phosphatase [Antiquaquibacter oligotrophicus]UDF12248.1 phosphatase PAP2 family protein [Antiquaquibacter oligotrophicus]